VLEFWIIGFLGCGIVEALAFAKFQPEQRQATANTIFSRQSSPTARNNPTDDILFYPLGCFYPLENFVAGFKIVAPLLHHSITPAVRRL
jgi:hypothetical protein